MHGRKLLVRTCVQLHGASMCSNREHVRRHVHTCVVYVACIWSVYKREQSCTTCVYLRNWESSLVVCTWSSEHMVCAQTEGLCKNAGCTHVSEGSNGHVSAVSKYPCTQDTVCVRLCVRENTSAVCGMHMSAAGGKVGVHGVLRGQGAASMGVLVYILPIEVTQAACNPLSNPRCQISWATCTSDRTWRNKPATTQGKGWERKNQRGRGHSPLHPQHHRLSGEDGNKPNAGCKWGFTVSHS